MPSVAPAPHYRAKSNTLEYDTDVADPFNPPPGLFLDGFQRAAWNEAGDIVRMISDASNYVQEKPLEVIDGQLSMEFVNQTHAFDLRAGDVIVMRMNAVRVKSGRGNSPVGEKVITWWECVLQNIETGIAGVSGETTRLNFEMVPNSLDQFFSWADAP